MTTAQSRYPADQLAKIIDPHFDRAHGANTAPGLCYGVVVDGELVHVRGLGTASLDREVAPHERTAFRIASMTKSFTAATVLSLRDEGVLSLDTPAADYVPELAAGGSHSAELTVRHLLTMGAGFLTDDPWGDRQQDLAIDTFRRLLAAGVAPVLPPGERFEYSNMGYALLGLVISSVTHLPYPQAVHARVLEPLGMGASGFELDEIDTADVADGYVRRSYGWEQESIASSGAFSPMGGLISTVSDIARWVGFFQSGGESVNIVSRLSVREMQRTQRLVGASASREVGEAPTVAGYGFGLFEEFNPWGRSVFHSGGYPGFGSHMRWHPASGIGVVALANGTYAPMSTVSTEALADTVRQLGVRTAPASVPLAGLDRAVAAVKSWLDADDLDGPEATDLRQMWADNVERDLPWGERQAAVEKLRREHGAFCEVEGSVKRPSAGAVSWVIRPTDAPTVGEIELRVTVIVAPHDPTLIQSLTLRPLPDKPVQGPPTTDLS